MIQTIYAEVPREKIIYLERAEFINGQEQSFRDILTASMSKHGFRDPVYCYYNRGTWGNKIKLSLLRLWLKFFLLGEIDPL